MSFLKRYVKDVYKRPEQIMESEMQNSAKWIIVSEVYTTYKQKLHSE